MSTASRSVRSPRRPAPQHGRLLAAAVAVAVVTSLAAVAPSLGAEASPGVPGASDRGPETASAVGSAATAPTGVGGPVETHRVTLITGDRVVLAIDAAGGQSVTVDTRAGDRATGVFPTFQAIEQGGDVYVFPAAVGPYLGTLLDEELFNVTGLVEQRYAESRRASTVTPVIVTYRPKAVRDLPDGVSRTADLASIHAVAGEVTTRDATTFGREVKAQLVVDRQAISKGREYRFARTGPLAGIETIHLDGQVTAALAESVPQIGAPEAWDAGFTGEGVDVAVLDTGIDGSHPDLVGKVAAEQNFTSDPTPADNHGHGTHVAATIAGTGDGSGGQRTGVAPDAMLMNGKVLDANGNGLESWIINGMEWAAANGADVISMSLQGGSSDGTDPMSQAVNRLTTEQGVLFTIASGNFGPGDQSVTLPGTADQALTVGAVDKSDVIAGFSGRGPRPGNFAVKPDITAPGVDIIAARATGTSLGEPVDDLYTKLSGTSMATPHVAGSAAIMLQEHPDWMPAQLKAALVSTADPGPYTVYQQGAGRVDVARAYAQGVYATKAPVDFGYFPYPQDAATPVTESLGFVNTTDAPVTLALTADVTGEDGRPAADGQFTLAASEVTVPAGGTASVDATVDPNIGPPSLYGGSVTATSADGSVVVTVPVGYYVEPETYNLTLTGFARDGRPAGGISWVDVVDAVDTTAFNQRVAFVNGQATLRVPAGTYSAMGFVFTYDDAHVYATEVSIAGDPEFEVVADTSVAIDARSATEVVAETDKVTEADILVPSVYRAGEELGSFQSSLLTGPPISRLFAAPTERVSVGEFEFYSKLHLRAPQLRVDVVKPEQQPVEASYGFGSPLVDGTMRLPMEFVGLGAPEDYEGRDVRGKLVLIARGTYTFAEKVANARAAGAAAAIIHNNVPGLLLIGVTDPGLPVLTVTQGQGLALRDLLEDGPVTTRLRGIVESPYIYEVVLPEPGRILDTHSYPVNRSNSVVVNATYRAHVDSWPAGDVYHAYRPYSNFSFDGVRNFIAPEQRKEYILTGDSRWWHQAWASMDNPVFGGESYAPIVTYPQRGTQQKSWFEQPTHPSTLRSWETGVDNGEPVLREDNTISAFVPEFVDPYGRWGFAGAAGDEGAFRLYENDQLIGTSPWFRGSYAVSGQPATYRAELDVTREAPYWTMSTRTETRWAFESQPPAGEDAEAVPLLLADWSLEEVDLLNRAPRGRYEIGLTVGRQQTAPPADVVDVRVWASFDDGSTWQQLSIRDSGDGEYTATVKHPRHSADFVSLRVSAEDEGGSTITQTIHRAYGLR